MRVRRWIASLSVGSMLLLTGCGSVTPAGSGTGGSGGEAGSGSSGSAGTTGGAGRSGTAGTNGSGSGGRGGVDGTAGTSGSAGVTGAGGVGVGGRGGTTGTAGAGATGTGGVAVGGRGGTTGAAGTTGTGGVAIGGRGGAPGGTGGGTTGGTGGGATAGRGGSTGAGGTGGVANGGRGGGNAGTGGGVSTCPVSGCPPLMISDLQAIDVGDAPGFDATGFRCKSLTICPNSSGCVYYSTDMFGSLQSMESTYTDGAEVAQPAPTKLHLDIGAASQCGNPAVTFTANDSITIQFDGGKKLVVLLPAFMGTSLSLYIATDGSTYYDAALTQPAGR
jgi:hypothetical protein